MYLSIVLIVSFHPNLGFHLIGFKPSDEVKRYLHIKPGKFIYPDEVVSWILVGDSSSWPYTSINNTLSSHIQNVSGSYKTFSAFLDRCIAKKVVPICSYVATAITPPRFVALLPQVCT